MAEAFQGPCRSSGQLSRKGKPLTFSGPVGGQAQPAPHQAAARELPTIQLPRILPEPETTLPDSLVSLVVAVPNPGINASAIIPYHDNRPRSHNLNRSKT